MFKCKKCGTQLEEKDKFCAYCGTKQEDKKNPLLKDKEDNNRGNIINLIKEKVHKVDINMEHSTDPNNKGIKLSNQVTQEHTIIEEEQGKENKELRQSEEYKKNEKSNTNTEVKLSKKLNSDDKIKQDIHNKKQKKSKKFPLIIALLFIFSFAGSYILLDSKSTKNSSKTDESSTTPISSNDPDKEKSKESVNKTNKVSKKTSGYILPNSDKEPLTSYDLQNMSKEQLALARNEIFARHGYKFGEPFKSYFESKSWYSVNPNYTDDMKELSPLERHNAKIILVAEGKGENLDSNYDADYYENNYNVSNNNQHNKQEQYYIQQVITGYLNNMTEAINRNDYSIVSPYIMPNSKLEMYQKDLIPNLNSQNVKEKLEDFQITKVENISSGVYKISTHEKYIIYTNGKGVHKEFDYVYTVVGVGTSWELSDIKT